MKKLKKVFAVLLSVAMILGMSSTVFAVDHMPTSEDVATITVNNVEEGATVKAFKIAKANYNAQGFTGYSVVGDYSIANLSKPTGAELLEIANKVDKDKGTTLSREGTSYQANLEVGMYLILVTVNGNTSTKVYNPMVASVYYSTKKSGDLNDQIGGTVDANDDYVVDGQKVWAKSSDVPISKEIVDSGSGNDYGDDTAIGDTIDFHIGSAFPSYSAEYTDVKFNIHDTLSKGLTYTDNSIEIYFTAVNQPNTDESVDADMQVGPQKIESSNYSVTSKKNENGETKIEIEFQSGFIKSNGGKEIEVYYKAVLNENAGINFDKNTNKVYAEYSNEPGTDQVGKTDEKKTYHYTFGIDAKLNGSGSVEEDTVTTELFKTGEKKTETSTSTEYYTPLDGAEFDLIPAVEKDGKLIAKPGAEAVKQAKSGYIKGDDDKWTQTGAVAGALQMTGLDAGKYVLVETKAPNGYSLNDTPVPVEITADYNEDGTLNSYTITINDQKTSTYTATYSKDGQNNKKTDEIESITKPGSEGNMGDKIENVNVTVETVENEDGTVTTITTKETIISVSTAIPNTQLGELPSTGGIGTIIFTVGGCLIMVAAAALYFANRRKAANSESK